MEQLKHIIWIKINRHNIKKYQWNQNLTIKTLKISLVDKNLMRFI